MIRPSAAALLGRPFPLSAGELLLSAPGTRSDASSVQPALVAPAELTALFSLLPSLSSLLFPRRRPFALKLLGYSTMSS